MMKSRVFVILGAFGLVAALAGCSGTAGPSSADSVPADETTDGSSIASDDAQVSDTGDAAASTCTEEIGTLEMWVDDSRVAALAGAVAAFKDEQCVTVNLVRKNFDDLRADFLSQVAAGEGPDITIGANDWLGEFKANGVIAPIDISAVSSELTPAAVHAYTSEGQTYGVPYAMENIGLVRNNALVSETNATTFDELIAEAKAVGTDYTILVQVGDKGDAFHMYPIQSSFGAPIFETDPGGDYTSTLGMAGDGGHAFAEYIAKLGSQGVLSVDINDSVAKDQFKAGKAPYIITGPWNTSGDESFLDAGMDITVLPIPSAGGQSAAPFLGVQGFYLSAKSENTLLAQMFLVDYLTRADVQLDLFKAGGRRPASEEAQADPVIANDPIMAGFAAAAADAQVQPGIPAMNQVWVPLGQEQADLISGKASDPAGTWDEMITNIADAIAKSAQ
ncbi:MAG: extracellular solute-binding protein [Bifidobacteriaceae bacterium]|jgi:arabinogalactan oligomer/maltooligosaccharide transport system substrate-binding protein|nr:extracellular solute-binding protein [Bifidobacteriaceae bacterium]